MFFLGKKNKYASNLRKSIKNIFGFMPGNIFLYELAFVHKSARAEMDGHEVSNERLEYLGDAVLDLIVAEYLFKKYPLVDEGELTEMRAKIVSRKTLNRLSENLGIDGLIQIKKAYTNGNKSYKGNALEAFFGAVFLDKGYLFAKKLLVEKIFSRHIDVDHLLQTEINFKSKLIEWCQKEKHDLDFEQIDIIGTGRRKQYFIEARIDNECMGRGIDFSIKGAEQVAAEKAMSKILAMQPSE
ncbi:MAG: ribonuclease III [Marinilabiliales bacterium]|mgnify:CR=1 FL=1|nr:MAG: ribonuclease III [Marinilabiliales bacterium]